MNGAKKRDKKAITSMILVAILLVSGMSAMIGFQHESEKPVLNSVAKNDSYLISDSGVVKNIETKNLLSGPRNAGKESGQHGVFDTGYGSEDNSKPGSVLSGRIRQHFKESPGIYGKTNSEKYYYETGSVSTRYSENPAYPTDEGSSDSWGYRWINSTGSPNVPYMWEDGINGGTATGLGDDGSVGPISLPFSFSYYDKVYNQVYICSNGWISFTDSDTWFQEDDFPNTNTPNCVISPLSKDLDPSSDGDVYYKSTADQFIVTWESVPDYGTSNYETFQIVLNSTGEIWFNYGSIADGSSANVGIENEDGAIGLDYDSVANLTSNMSIEFFYVPPPYGIILNPQSYSSIGNPGDDMWYTLEIYNRGANNDTYDLTSNSPWPATIYDATGSTQINQISVNSGEIKDFMVRVSIPSGASAGDFDICNVTVSSQNDSANATATASLTTQVLAPILVVDDDSGLDTENWYYSALDADNYAYNFWDVQNWGSPDLSTLEMHNVTIWFTGNDYGSSSDTLTLTEEDRDNLGTYLHNGGRLYLSSWGVGPDAYWNNGWSSWYEDYLHAHFVDTLWNNPHSYNGLQFDSVGDGMRLDVGTGDVDWKLGGNVARNNPANGGIVSFNFTGNSEAGMIRADTGIYRVVYSGFDFAYVNDSSIRSQLMYRIIHWLTTPYGVSVEPQSSAGVGNASETVSYTLTINNTGSLDDTYNLSVLDNSWSTTIYDSNGNVINAITVPAHSSSEIDVRVTIPSGANISDYDTATILARSQNNNMTMATSHIRTIFPYTMPFFDDMESLKKGWQASGLWHLIDSGNYSEYHSYNTSWWYGQDSTGNYDTGYSNSGMLTTPYIKLRNLTSTPQLDFWEWYETEGSYPSYDQRWVEINNGTGWKKIIQLNESLMDTWQKRTINLSAYKGQVIQIGFYFDTMDSYSNAYRGWYIDDVSITVPRYKMEMKPSELSHLGEAGNTVSYNITIINHGLENDTYNLTSNSPWPATIYDATGSTQINQISVNSGEIKDFMVRVSIPSGASAGDFDICNVTVSSQNDSANATATASLTTQVLAPILVVDDDSGLDTENLYYDALDSNGYVYNFWYLQNWGNPDLNTLQSHNVTIWFTGNDGDNGMQTLTYEDRNNIGQYLDDGGRLYLSSCGAGPDAYWNNGWSSWYEDYLHAKFTGTYLYSWPSSFMGVDYDAIGDGMILSSRYSSVDSYGENEPTNGGIISFNRSDAGDGGLIRANTGAYRTVYSSFDFSNVNNASIRSQLMYRIIHWLTTPYGVSVEPQSSAGVGNASETVSYTLTINNTGSLDDTYNLSVLDNSWSTTIYDSNGNVINAISVPANSSADIEVGVSIPSGANMGDYDTATILVRSQNDNMAMMAAHIKTIYPYTLPFFDDMESLKNGWVTHDNGAGTEWQLGTPNNTGPSSAYSGSTCWGTNINSNYTQGADVTLDTPPVDLRDVYTANISYYHWYSIYGDWPGDSADDGGYIEVSTDGGFTWQYVTPEEGYNETIDRSSPIGYNGCYGQNSNGWVRGSVDLTPFVGHVVIVRFHFWSEPWSDTWAGWYIDDVNITSTRYKVDLSPSQAFRFGNPGDSVWYNLTLMNQGMEDDTYALSISGNNWTTEIYDENGNATSQIALNSGEKVTLRVRVDIPPSANLGDGDYVNLTVESNNDTNTSAMAHLGTYYLTGPRNVAIFQTKDPWGISAIQDILSLWDIPYTIYGTEDIGNVNLSMYDKVIIVGSDGQYSYFYKAISGNKSWFESYVSNGGVLNINVADWGDFNDIPCGLSATYDEGDTVDIYNADSSLLNIPNTISDAELDNWDNSYHRYFTDWPSGADVVLTEGNTGNSWPVLLDYPWGDGHVIATGLTSEWAWYHGYSRILENLILAMNLTDVYSENETTPPYVVDTDPSDGATGVSVNKQITIEFSESIDTSTFNFTCSPNPGGWAVSWDSDNTTATISHSAFGFNTTYRISVNSADDTAGNSLSGAPYDFNFTTESTSSVPPVVVSHSPAGNDVATNASILIRFNKTMNTSSVESAISISPSVSGLSFSWNSSETAVTITHDAFSENTEYTININASIAKDVNGNTLDGNGNGTAEGHPTDDYSWSFTTASNDQTPPNIEISSPSDGDTFNTSSITVSWTGSDNVGIDHYAVRIDGGEWSDVGTATSHDFTGLSEGSHTVDVKAVDGAGNEATDSVTFTIDTINPSMSITSPSEDAIFNTSSITVSWTGSDNVGIDHYELRIDGGDWINVGTSTSHEFTALPDGIHKVELKAIDTAENSAMAYVNFTTDVTKPLISITSPSDGSTLDNSTVNITWQASDSGTGISSYSVRIDDGSWMSAGNRSFYVAVLTEGNHTIEVMARDVAGNTATASVSVVLNHTPEPGTISGTVIDRDGKPVEGARVTLDSGESAITDQDGHFVIKAAPGNHTLTVSKDGYESESTPVSLTSGESKELPPMTLSQLPSSSSPSGEFPVLYLLIALAIIAIIVAILVAKRRKPPEESVASTESGEFEPSGSPEELPTEDGGEAQEPGEEMSGGDDVSSF